MVMALNTEILFELSMYTIVYTSGSLLEVLGNSGEGPFISGK